MRCNPGPLPRGTSTDRESTSGNTRGVSVFPRERLFFSTLPIINDHQAVARPPPWDGDFVPLRDAHLSTLMRTRQSREDPQGSTRVTTYQYKTSHLLFRSEWVHGGRSVMHIVQDIARQIPNNLRSLWMGMSSGMYNDRNEAQYLPLARWLAQHGSEVETRPPNGTERARSYGAIGEYLLSLGLAEHELIDATGNMFDPDSLLDRIARPIKRYLRGQAMPAARFLPPTEIFRMYERVSGVVARNGL